MKFKVEIDMSNAAFEDDTRELSRILHGLADKLADRALTQGDLGNIVDYNGNRVGAWKVQK